MKYYKKFYEVGNNRYYTIVADGDTYLGTESFIEFIRPRLFFKRKELTQGFKLLKLSVPMLTLFLRIRDVKQLKGQKGVDKSLIKYEQLSDADVKEDIKVCYEQVFDAALNDIEKFYKDNKSSCENKKQLDALTKRYKEAIETARRNNPIKNGAIDITKPDNTSSNMVKTMLKEGLSHLYTERVTAFSKDIYLYDFDCFGTVTIYRVKVVKNVVKTIDTFIYDKKLIEELLNTMYNEENK